MILLTADHHIKLGQKNVPIDWSRNRYRMLFEQIHAIGCTLHIMAGDIFDKLPNMDELELYFEFVKEAKVRTLITTGNHEATKKGKTFFTALKGVTNAVNPLVEVIDFIHSEDDWTIVPYEFIHKKETWEKVNTPIVFTHIRGEIPPHVKPEIPLEWLDKYKVVYLGDLHSHSNCQRNMVYPGSPLTTSFHRNEVKTGYILIDDNDHSRWTWHEFHLPQLIRKTVTSPEEMVETDYHRTIYEIEGSIVDLGTVKNTELLDKKLVKRSTDTTLILDKDMTMEEELVEYLTYVQELPSEQIQEVITTFHDYAAKI